MKQLGTLAARRLATSRRQPKKPSPNAISTPLCCIAARYHYCGTGSPHCRMPAVYRIYRRPDGQMYWLIEEILDENGMTSDPDQFAYEAAYQGRRLRLPVIIEGPHPRDATIKSRSTPTDKVLVQLLAARPEWRRVAAEFVLDRAAGLRPIIDRSRLT